MYISKPRGIREGFREGMRSISWLIALWYGFLAFSEGSTGGGAVFGVSLSQCVENERVSRQAAFNASRETTFPDDNQLGLRRKSHHGSRSSFSSLIEARTLEEVRTKKWMLRETRTFPRATPSQWQQANPNIPSRNFFKFLSSVAAHSGRKKVLKSCVWASPWLLVVVVEGQGGICPRRRPHSRPIELQPVRHQTPISLHYNTILLML